MQTHTTSSPADSDPTLPTSESSTPRLIDELEHAASLKMIIKTSSEILLRSGSHPQLADINEINDGRSIVLNQTDTLACDAPPSWLIQIKAEQQSIYPEPLKRTMQELEISVLVLHV
jgi:hypothetical protein